LQPVGVRGGSVRHMDDVPFRNPWGGHDPQMESIVKLDDKCLGLRMKLASGERVTMPLGQTTFHMRLDHAWSQPRKARVPKDDVDVA
jgi:hypothetical protein